MYVCMYVCMYACMYVCMYICMYVWYVCMYVYIDNHLGFWFSFPICMYVCMCVCMYARMYACMYVRMYVCMYVCIYVCMHVCMHVFIYWFISFGVSSLWKRTLSPQERTVSPHIDLWWECLFYRALLQKRPVILRSLLIVATLYYVNAVCHKYHSQYISAQSYYIELIAFWVSINTNLHFQACGSLSNDIWQKSPRERGQRARFESEEMTLHMQHAVYIYIRLIPIYIKITRIIRICIHKAL